MAISQGNNPTPLPVYQLFIVSLTQFTEPLATAVIFPFVNQFVRLTGITNGDERRTGYYAGLIESAFFVAEGITVYHWGAASDRLGRRPILLLGPIGIALAIMTFGLSTEYWMLLACRAIQGIFNGNIGVAKSVIAEISDPTNIADAYAFMPLVWGVGTTIGSAIGGFFSEPAKRWPLIFGDSAFLKGHPYFLPCAVAGSIAFVSGVIAFIGLRESSSFAIAQQQRQLWAHDTSSSPEIHQTTPLLDGTVREFGSCNPIEGGRRGQPELRHTNDGPPPITSFLNPQVLLSIAVYMFQCFVDISSLTLLPLMYSTSIPLGGLGFDAYHIGLILSSWGVINAFVIITSMGPLIRKFGPRTVHIFSYATYFLNTALYPLLGYLVRRSGSVDRKVWAVIVLQLMCRIVNGMSYGSILIIIVNSAPSKASVGATNGLAQTAACLSRALAPSVASSLFSVTLQHQTLGGNMVYIVLSGVAVAGMGLAYLLPKKLDLPSHNEGSCQVIRG